MNAQDVLCNIIHNDQKEWKEFVYLSVHLFNFIPWGQKDEVIPYIETKMPKIY